MTAPDFSATALVTKEPYRREADRERLRQGMLAAGLPDWLPQPWRGMPAMSKVGI